MSNDRGRVLITGVGVVSPFGRGVEAFWRALLEGTAASSGRLRAYEPPPNLDADARSHLGRCSLFAADAAIQAVEDAALPFTAQTAPLMGVAIGSDAGERERPVPGAPATSIARVLGVAGPVLSLAGPSSGLAAVAEAFELVKRGLAPVVIAGGVDVGPIEALSGAAEDAGRPFDSRRRGNRPAEVAAVFVLEDSEVATGRGARVSAAVLGGGSTFSRATVMRPEPNFIDAARAMRAALLRAEIFQGEVETIFTSANGDVAGDEAEARALKDLWGPNADRLTVTSIHGAAGLAPGASGALSLAAAVRSLAEGVVPAAIGCEHLGEPFAVLDIVLGSPRAWRYNTAMVNAFSEAANVALVIRSATA